MPAAARTRLAVCEIPPALEPGTAAWRDLAGCVRASRPDLVLLAEMPFGRWLAGDPDPDPRAFAESCRLHEAGIALFDDFGGAAVLATRPTLERDRRVNQAFVWEPGRGVTPVQTKQFLPNEAGYWEARWFARGDTRFQTAAVRGLGVGFLTCTEVWFNEWARRFGRSGVQLIAVPRVTPRPSLDCWQTAVRMAALVSGCYAATSNRVGIDSRGQEFGGGGWVYDPTGKLVAETAADRPVMAVELDRELCARAQRDYPCYVEELPGRATS